MGVMSIGPARNIKVNETNVDLSFDFTDSLIYSSIVNIFGAET